MDDKFQFSDLRCPDANEDNVALTARICSLSMQKCDTAVHVVDDTLRDFPMTIGDDQHGLALIESSDDLIHHRRIDEHIDQREHRRRHAKQECGNQHDETVEREKHAAHVQIIVLSHDRRKDVESARAAVHAEYNAVA